MSDEEPGPRSGHLGFAWEVAVVAAFVIVIVAVIGVAVFHIRRRRRRSQVAELETSTTRRKKKRRRGKKVESVEIEVKDLESGQCEVVTELPDEDDYVDSELESEGVDPTSRPARPKSTSNAKPKSSRHKKASSAKKTIDPSSEEYYFEHPSQKPPKYYWNQR